MRDIQSKPDKNEKMPCVGPGQVKEAWEHLAGGTNPNGWSREGVSLSPHAYTGHTLSPLSLCTWQSLCLNALPSPVWKTLHDSASLFPGEYLWLYFVLSCFALPRLPLLTLQTSVFSLSVYIHCLEICIMVICNDVFTCQSSPINFLQSHSNKCISFWPPAPSTVPGTQELSVNVTVWMSSFKLESGRCARRLPDLFSFILRCEISIQN